MNKRDELNAAYAAMTAHASTAWIAATALGFWINRWLLIGAGIAALIVSVSLLCYFVWRGYRSD